jgi:hypothetical protein
MCILLQVNSRTDSCQYFSAIFEGFHDFYKRSQRNRDKFSWKNASFDANFQEAL